jgi:hypothetical protein
MISKQMRFSTGLEHNQKNPFPSSEGESNVPTNKKNRTSLERSILKKNLRGDSLLTEKSVLRKT